MREQAAVEAALLHQHDMVAVRIGIDRARAHAAGRAFAADDQRLHAELREMRHERRAEEHAGALLGDHDVVRLRLELWPDGEVGGIDRRLVALGCRHHAWAALRAHVAGRIEDRKTGAARRREQPLGGLDRGIGVFAAAAGMGLGQLDRRTRAAAIDELIKIDCQQRRARTNEDFSPVAGIDLQHIRRDDVLPAMVLEIVGHGVAPLAEGSAGVTALQEPFQRN